MADVSKLLLMFFLFQECLAQFTLDPNGVVRVCTGQNQQFLCTSVGVTWTISGFGNGISDQRSPTTALTYAGDNIRVTTTDNATISNPSTLTFMMLGYPDDSASVTCTDSMRSTTITSTIRIAPTNCTLNFMELNTTSSTITITLAVSNCAGSMPTYRVTARSMSSGVVTTALNIMSTVFLMSSLEADTGYDIEVVDIECLNIILNRLSVMTKMDPIASPPTHPSPTAASPTTAPSFSDGCGGITAGVPVGCLFLSLLATMATGIITFLCTRKRYKKTGPPSPNEKSVYYETVQSDSVQMQPSPAYESVEKKM